MGQSIARLSRDGDGKFGLRILPLALLLQNAYVTIDATAFPLVRIIFAAAEPNDAEFDAYLKTLLALYERCQPCVMLINAEKSTFLRAELRIRQGEWLKKHDALVRTYLLSSAFYVPSALPKMMLKAIFLVQKPVFAYVVSDRVEEAEAWAMARVATKPAVLARGWVVDVMILKCHIQRALNRYSPYSVATIFSGMT